MVDKPVTGSVSSRRDGSPSSRTTDSFPAFQPSPNPLLYRSPEQFHEQRSSDEDGTLRGEHDDYDPNHLRITTSFVAGSDHIDKMRTHSPSVNKEENTRQYDDLEMARVEQTASNIDYQTLHGGDESGLGRNKSVSNRSRSRTVVEEPDVFDTGKLFIHLSTIIPLTTTGTTPLHERSKIYQPPPHPATKIARLIKRVHQSSVLVRWFVYITPLTLIILVPLLLGLLVFKDASVAGVKLFWFSIWLMIVWLSLWAARIIAKGIPHPMGMVSSIFTNNSKKWRDLGRALEIPATLFFWWLAIEISFLPTMTSHHVNGNSSTKPWEKTMNKVLVAIFVGVILNFVSKIIIQLIAMSFHLRTYADRIEINKFQIGSLVKLYKYSKEKIEADDSEFEEKEAVSGTASGTRTPMVYIEKAQKVARQGINAVGDVAGKVAGDFTGKTVTASTHPHQVILQLLSTNGRSQVLARRLWRTYRQHEQEHVSVDDLKAAFDNDDEADAAFQMFDKDMNGDISMEELEAVCVEIGRERKAITASLKDLDSVVSKLDDFFLFVVCVITMLVFISLISTSAAGVLTSAGSAVLALSWLFSATAQEFLQSCIFVFVKHPFDVGDRVTIYGNTGNLLMGDDYFVKEISLLYTEFKKMQGHVVQAPNSYLNTLFVLNQRRSGALAEAIPVVAKFGTTIEQIEALRERLLEFVTSEKREYQTNILTELTTITEAKSITVNVVFFYKSNWQNELLRLQRRNKFICALMITMQELGIEGPHRVLPGGNSDFPMYLSGAYPPNTSAPSYDDQPPHDPDHRSGSLAHATSIAGSSGINDAPRPQTGPQAPARHPSILRNRGDSSARSRGESFTAMGRRVDFSLGMSNIAADGTDFGDVFFDSKPKFPSLVTTSPSPSRSSKDERRRVSEDSERLGLTTSRDSASALGINRSPSISSNFVTHRNRFFSRTRSKLSQDNDESRVKLEDLEAGRRELVAGDMPHIPEASGSRQQASGTLEDVEEGDEENGSGRASRTEDAKRKVAFTRRSTLATSRPSSTDAHDSIEMSTRVPQSAHKLDPRTGVISPVAVTSDEARDQGTMLASLGAGQASDLGAGFAIRRSQTER